MYECGRPDYLRLRALMLHFRCFEQTKTADATSGGAWVQKCMIIVGDVRWMEDNSRMEDVRWRDDFSRRPGVYFFAGYRIIDALSSTQT